MNTSRARGQIQTFADLRGGSGRDDDGDDEDGEGKPEEYYAGGEKSGIAVMNPNQGKGKSDSGKALRDSVFDSVKDKAISKDEYERTKSGPFAGSARMLGSSGAPSILTNKPLHEEIFHVIVHMYEDGFTVQYPDMDPADCELRNYADPSAQEFLKSLEQQKVPREMFPKAGSRKADIELMKTETKYERPKRTFKAFKGTGQLLSGSSNGQQHSPPGSSTAATYPSLQPVPVGSTKPVVSGRSSQVPFKLDVDSSKPTTQIAVRCIDGSRLVGIFNLTHTVKDIYSWVSSEGKGPLASFSLATSFPRKVLDDSSLTIAAAGLQNASLNQSAK
jgi:UBX domain-containing protein 1